MDSNNDGDSAFHPPEIQPQSFTEEDPGAALGQWCVVALDWDARLLSLRFFVVQFPHIMSLISLLSQYGITFAAISTSTAYAVYKRPKNGMQIMIVAGATGTLADFLYGWTMACTEQVTKSREYNERKQEFEGLQRANGVTPSGSSGKWF